MSVQYKLVKIDENATGNQLPTLPRGSIYPPVATGKNEHFSDVLSQLSPDIRSKAEKILPYIEAKVKLQEDSNRIVYGDSQIVGSPLADLLKFLVVDGLYPKPWDSGLFVKEIGKGIPGSLLSPSALRHPPGKI